jgi:uncharacterized protein (TIGR02145 family)
MKAQFPVIANIIIITFLFSLISCKKDSSSSPPPSLKISNSTVTDIDGNVYETVTIGTQVWMTSNLKTTKYNDGTDIPLVTANTDWGNLSSPGYCWSNNDIAYKNIYGALYNWYTVNTGKLCPTGWHVPTIDEFSTLIAYAGGGSLACKKLKETGISHWRYDKYYGSDRNDPFGFAALPGGYRVPQPNEPFLIGNFQEQEKMGYWWSSTEDKGTSYKLNFEIRSDYANTFGADPKWGLSVRCIRD